MNRNQYLQTARELVFDICIIGGGATGAGCALEAQSRGLQTILIEKEDFAAGTSSKSTKLIHGGVRYLEQAVKKLSWGQYVMVRKALQERKNLLDTAPHVTRPLALLTPCHNWFSSVYYFFGLKLYDWISGNGNIGKSRLLSKKQSIDLLPGLKADALYNSVLYYDGQMDDQRLNMAIIQTACEKGAVCINHCRAVRFTKDESGKITELEAVDLVSNERLLIRAKSFVNACGPFADAIRLMANDNTKPRIRVSKGVHLLLAGNLLKTNTGLLIPETRDGRVIFVLPYGDYLLAGTTDEEVTLTEKDFGPTRHDVDYILEYVNEYLDIHAGGNDVLAGFGGLRPLVAADENNTKDLVRDHIVEVDGYSGLISILGGKWTTYRLMARDTINAVAKQLHLPAQINPVKMKLKGSRHFGKNLLAEVKSVSGCDLRIAKHLVSKYGDQALMIAEMLRESTENHMIVEGLPYTYSELQYVIEQEMAVTVKDVINRRWGVEICNWQEASDLIDPVGAYMTSCFKWNEKQREEYIESYRQEIVAMIYAAKN